MVKSIIQVLALQYYNLSSAFCSFIKYSLIAGDLVDWIIQVSKSIPEDAAILCFPYMGYQGSFVLTWQSLMYIMAELAVGNIVRRVLHIIREEDLSLTTAVMDSLNLSSVSDDEDGAEHHEHPVLSAAPARITLRPPSLQTLLEDVPDAVAVPHTNLSAGDSEGKSKCKILF